MRKKSEKRLKIPTLFYDGKEWLTISDFPSFQVYTDRILSEVLQVSKMRVSLWRSSGVIPHTMCGNFALYRVNDVIKSLLKNGYEQDETLKKCEYENK